uniref:Interleukin 22 receptor subunit alpha 2 n=1 Tax=Pavo cristatus TaxID=9049 RepID=A0A8C9F596_PAVCR
DMPKRKRDALSHGADLLSMRGIRLSSLYAIKPREVRFYSLNFNNTLRWQPGRAGEGETTLYFVQYKVAGTSSNMTCAHMAPQCGTHIWFVGRLWGHQYGQSRWQNKEECWGIQSHFCDLTEETSDAYEPYYGRVQAASDGVRSDWSLSCRFTPWRESKCKHTGSLSMGLGFLQKRGSMIPMTNYYDLLYQVFIINNLLDEVSAYSDTNSLPLNSQENMGTLFLFTAETALWDWKSVNGCESI